MAAPKLNTNELFASIDNSVTELLQTIALLSETQINTIPFKDSWTAAKVAVHVTKSTNSIAQALSIKGNKVERNPGERVPELKEVFLNFHTKMKSPAFILPTLDTYEKETVIAELKKSFTKLKAESQKINLSEAINHSSFGDITKLELLYFVVYHTQRHIHQAKKILKMIKRRNTLMEGI